MTAWLIDTNVLSESIRPRPSPLVQAFLARETDLWLSVMTLHEIAYGAERSSDPVKKQQLLSWLGVIRGQFEKRTLDVNWRTAEMAGRLRATADLKGRLCKPIDALIGGTAIVNGLTLVTRNTKDFEVFGMALHNPFEEN